MSEQSGTPATGEPTTTPNGTDPAATTQGDPADKPLGPNGEKALSAEREARKAAEKAAADLKAQLDKIEADKLSDLERAQKAAKDAQDAAAKATREAMVARVALTKGIKPSLVKYLTGDTEEAVSASADELLAELTAPTTPRPDPSQGAKGNTKPLDPAAAFAAAFEGHI